MVESPVEINYKLLAPRRVQQANTCAPYGASVAAAWMAVPAIHHTHK